MAINEKELNEVSGGYGHRDPLRCHCAADLPVEQHQEPRPHLHQPEADHLSHHPALSDRQHQSPAKRRGISVSVLFFRAVDDPDTEADQQDGKQAARDVQLAQFVQQQRRQQHAEHRVQEGEDHDL